jgi:ribonuclease BN (tRNA processing enzyme)
MKLTMLGTGLPMPNPARKGPSQVVSLADTHVLVDCGPGAVHRLSEAHVMPRNIHHVMITHHHADHYLDLGYFILVRWLMGVDRPLQVYGPQGQKRMIEGLLGLHEFDFRNRLGVMAPNRQLPDICVTEFEEGRVAEISGMKVSAFVTPHLPEGHSFGFRFDSRDKTIVLSGDTAPSENVIRHAHGADILVHECVDSRKSNLSSSPAFASPEERLKHMAAIHTFPEFLGPIARDASVKTLVTTHMVPASVPEELTATIARDFSGEIIIGEDLMQIER